MGVLVVIERWIIIIIIKVLLKDVMERLGIFNKFNCFLKIREIII